MLVNFILLARFAKYSKTYTRIGRKQLEYIIFKNVEISIRVCSFKYVCVCAGFVINMHFWLNVRFKIIHYTR